MATNPDGYETLMAQLAATGKVATERLIEQPPLVNFDIPAAASPAPPLANQEQRQESPPAEPAPVAPELDRFFQLPAAEHKPEASPTDQPAEEARATLPEWAWAALLAGCAEAGERRRREDEERRARERRQREQR